MRLIPEKRMVDRISSVQRSANMAAIHGRDTGPELIVRRLLCDIGVRYRLHVADLPGRPDIVMHNRRKIIEVRGCFWHQHKECRLAYEPKTRTKFWRDKFRRNVERDVENENRLKDLGYGVLVVWECETEDTRSLLKRLKKFLERMERSTASNKKGIS
jgi:DNA mismatch endonuclease (patch repair protein)